MNRRAKIALIAALGLAIAGFVLSLVGFCECKTKGYQHKHNHAVCCIDNKCCNCCDCCKCCNEINTR